MKRYTECELEDSGWYWFIPDHSDIWKSGPHFVRVDEDIIEAKALWCKKYNGDYIGPIDIEAIEKGSTDEQLPNAYKAIDAIEKIVSDDFCEDLEMKAAARTDMSEDLVTAYNKLSRIYMIAHSESPNHKCYSAHDDWRKLKDE